MTESVALREHGAVPRPRLETWQPERLNAARRAKGWTVAQLATAAELNFPAVDVYLHGRSAPDPATLVHLAAVLEVTTTYLAPLRDKPRLHELRWHAGLSVRAFAKRIGRSEGQTSRALRGEVRITEPDRWADVLGVTRTTIEAAWVATRADLDPRSR